MGNINCFKYRPVEGKIWSLVFNHPLRLNSNGEKGRWTRRSLKTVDSKVADGFVNQMKELLSQKDLWEGENGRTRAEKMYNSIVISAFYDSILPEIKDNESTPIRENLLPLPSSDDGYNKVLFVGNTGAGKSTLLGHLIGTTSENFPFTTAAKATVSDLEVIVAKGEYKAAVTFFTRQMTEAFIQERVYDALLKAMNGGDKSKIFKELEENKEQTFRLRNILGNFQDKKSNMKKSSFFDDNLSDVSEEDEDFLPQSENKNNMTEYLEKIIQLSDELKLIFPEKESETDKKSESTNSDSELLQKTIYENEDFKFLVNEIIKDIESRFSLVNKGFLRVKNKWPQYWEFETTDRKEFLNSLNVFYSNNYEFFGKLLTPLVQGMRVQGPFYSKNSSEEYPKLVFFDGQGIGHTAESAKALSLPLKVENKFELVDVILLVDNATIPMQHSPLLVLKSVVASGFTDRLFIAFTHFDSVKGENFGSVNDRQMHVYNSLRNGISELKKEIGPIMVSRLDDYFDDRCLYLENLEKNKSEIGEKTLKQLNKLLQVLQRKTEVISIVSSKPQYDEEKFSDEIYSSIEKFRVKWDIRFSGVTTRVYDTRFDSHDVSKVPWQTIRALNRRIAELGINEFYPLMPVTELKDFIQAQISRYLDDSLIWGIKEPSNEDKYEFREAVKRNISKKLIEFIKIEMIDELMGFWIRAYNHSGPGSTKLRARDIDFIYDQVSPLMKRSANWREYVSKIKRLVDDSIDSAYEATMSKFADVPDEPSNFIECNVS